MSAGQLTTPHRHLQVSHRASLAVGLAVVAVAAVAATGLVVQRGSVPVAPAAAATSHAGNPAPGEFILAPGNLPAIGITVRIPANSYAWPGEFKLGPGNQPAPGIVNPLPRVMSGYHGPVPMYAPGEFALSPGNTPALGIVVPLNPVLVPARGEFRLGPGNQPAPGITVPLATTAR